MGRASPAKPVVEQCWTLAGRRRGAIWYARRIRGCSGEPAQVAFDAAAVLQREERLGDVLGFYHTHPHAPAAPSRRDVHTMRAWVSAFGKPLLCLIAAPEVLAAYRFDDDASDGTLLPMVERFPRGIIIAVESNRSGQRGA